MPKVKTRSGVKKRFKLLKVLKIIKSYTKQRTNDKHVITAPVT